MENYLLLKNSKVYVLCPNTIKTGGTELLHQLVYHLNRKSIEAYICYLSPTSDSNIIKEFQKYVFDFVLFSDIVDEEKNIVIIPERYTYLCDKIHYAQKAIWWLSVDNYLVRTDFSFTLKNYGFKHAIYFIGRKVFKVEQQKEIERFSRDTNHFVQSYYAYDFLKRQGICTKFLSDYINESFCESTQNLLKKEDIIVYNPQKGYSVTKRIMRDFKKRNSKNFKWIPLIGMTNEQVKMTLQKAKVYIDFGNFPGKDRIPREAALSYCCVITGTNGAAQFHEDFPINKKYKFDNPLRQLKSISSIINLCIEDYENVIQDFSAYREIILSEKETFEKQIDTLFNLNPIE
jgi:hypothetical protein